MSGQKHFNKSQIKARFADVITYATLWLLRILREMKLNDLKRANIGYKSGPMAAGRTRRPQLTYNRFKKRLYL